ncbi:TPA: hypothetical protein EYP84_02765 [Candidatus Bipolaricaulota bacterium]|nr:hypothetical protein [Candidatus Bipolaricaulota bacterium]
MKLSRRAEWALGWLETIVVAGGAAWLIISFVTVRMTVPTGSMIPTIMPGDSFFVDRISYYFREPDVGDVIVFWHVEEIRVTGVKPGSPAAQAGVQVGDPFPAFQHPPSWRPGFPGARSGPSPLTVSVSTSASGWAWRSGRTQGWV